MRDLGVLLVQELSMKQHINKGFYHLRHLKQDHRLLRTEFTAHLISAIVATLFDYCNVLLAILHKFTICITSALQRIQNAMTKLLSVLRFFDHVAPALQQLH